MYSHYVFPIIDPSGPQLAANLAGVRRGTLKHMMLNVVVAQRLCREYLPAILEFALKRHSPSQNNGVNGTKKKKKKGGKRGEETKRSTSLLCLYRVYLNGRYIIMRVVDVQPTFPFTGMRTATDLAHKEEMILRFVAITVDTQCISISRNIHWKYLFRLQQYNEPSSLNSHSRSGQQPYYNFVRRNLTVTHVGRSTFKRFRAITL